MILCIHPTSGLQDVSFHGVCPSLRGNSQRCCIWTVFHCRFSCLFLKYCSGLFDQLRSSLSPSRRFPGNGNRNNGQQPFRCSSQSLREDRNSSILHESRHTLCRIPIPDPLLSRQHNIFHKSYLDSLLNIGQCKLISY